MAAAPGVRQPFEYQETDAFGEAETVGRGGERLAPAVGGQGPLPAELDERSGGGHDGHPTGQRQAAFVGAECLGGQMDGYQGRGTRGVDGYRRSFQTESVGDAAGGDTCGAAGQDITFNVPGHLPLEGGGVFLGDDSGENTGVAAAQLRRVDAGMFERLPCRFQQQPLLWIGGERFARGHPEEGGVEFGRVVEETTPTHIESADPLGVGVIEAIDIPAAVGGQAADDVTSFDHQLPQILTGPRAAREPAAHTDYRDGFPRG